MSRETNTPQTRDERVTITGLSILRPHYGLCRFKRPGVFLFPLDSLLVHRRLVFSIFVTFPKHFCRYLDLYLHRYPKLIA